MTPIEQGLLSVLGEEKTIELCEKLPGITLPGKKFRLKILRQRFYRDRWIGARVAAEKYGVSLRTVYNWMHSE